MKNQQHNANFLCTEREEGKDDTNAVPAVGGSNDILHATENFIRSGPVLASVPGSSNLSDTLRSSFNRTLSSLRLCVGRGKAGEAEDKESDGEAHDDVRGDVCKEVNNPHVLRVDAPA